MELTLEHRPVLDANYMGQLVYCMRKKELQKK